MAKQETAAISANGKSRMCAKCPLNKRCTEEIFKICRASFLEGFKKGVKWQKKQ